MKSLQQNQSCSDRWAPAGTFAERAVGAQCNCGIGWPGGRGVRGVGAEGGLCREF